jgi:hypothetical protein
MENPIVIGKRCLMMLNHLIVGDAELTTWAMQDEILVSTVDGARGKQEVQCSATMFRTFHATYPHVQIWFSHDEDHL